MGLAFSKKFRESFDWILAKWWDSQFSPKLIKYNARSKGLMDVRKVFNITSEQERVFLNLIRDKGWKDLDNDVKIVFISTYVNDRMMYKRDVDGYGKVEYWADPFTVWKKGVDDCDGWSVLICKLAWLSGIPKYRLKLVAGNTDAGPHAYCNYLKESDNEWYTIEGSFYNQEAITRFIEGIPHSKANRYQTMWWSTNDMVSWAQKDLVIKTGLI